MWSCSDLYVLKLHQVSLNLDEKQKSFLRAGEFGLWMLALSDHNPHIYPQNQKSIIETRLGTRWLYAAKLPTYYKDT